MGIGGTALLVAATAAAVALLPGLLKPKLPKLVHGFTADGWEHVGQVFRQAIEEGTEKGAAYAVYHKGELVVEYWGGYADEEAERPWNRDTINCFFSSTKGVSATVVAMLVDRGHLEYDKPVASYWPEFAQNGKEKITVRQILSHTAGLAWYDEPTSVQDIVDNNQKISDALAKQKPGWTPGTQHGYHGITIGMYIDQLVRRVDPKHRDLASFYRQEVAEPHGVDLHIGLPPELNYRCARIMVPSLWSAVETGSWGLIQKILGMIMSKDHVMTKMVRNPAGFSVAKMNDPSLQRIPCGSSRGFGTVTGLAKHYSLVVMDKLIQSQAVLKDMTLPRAGPGMDSIVPMNLTYASGFNLIQSKLGSTMFGTPGAGGQMGFADLQYQLSWAYTTNYHKMALVDHDLRWKRFTDAVYDVIKEKCS